MSHREALVTGVLGGMAGIVSLAVCIVTTPLVFMVALIACTGVYLATIAARGNNAIAKGGDLAA